MRPGEHGPFDDSQARTATPDHQQGYQLSESYTGEYHGHGQAPPYNGYHSDTSYSGSTMTEPKPFPVPVPGRTPSPYAYDDQNSDSDASMEAWKQRQAPGGPGGIRRYQTRKVKLHQGSVLSVEYPVPSAIQNSVQAKYRNDLESGSEEFTHLRCTSCSDVGYSCN